jgi:hypothetical protein
MFTREQANAFRDDGSDRGHYESYFQRANHPSRPLAFWIRYTTFVPQARRSAALAELWAVYFDGEERRIIAVREERPLIESRFSSTELAARIGDAVLDDRRLSGKARHEGHDIAWSLRYSSTEPPLLLLPERLYSSPFPKAKALVGSPLARFSGELRVDGRRIDVDDWVGSQNHNWGCQHTDRYAWGQVAGFDDAPDAFFECATASLKVGPVYTPRMTLLVLRYGGEEFRMNSVPRSLLSKGSYRPFTWTVKSERRGVAIEASIYAEPDAFVALPYGNPPGGIKICLNSKIAACALRLERKGKPTVRLRTRSRAAFEILTDQAPSGVAVLGAGRA